MAIHPVELRARPADQATLARADALAALPGHTIVAIFENRGDAEGAALQLLTSDPAAVLWLRSGREAGAAIRRARAGRGLVTRLLRGFGDEELMVREVLRQTDDGRSVLVIKNPRGNCPPTLHGASHIYQFGLWTVRVIR